MSGHIEAEIVQRLIEKLRWGVELFEEHANAPDFPRHMAAWHDESSAALAAAGVDGFKLAQ